MGGLRVGCNNGGNSAGGSGDLGGSALERAAKDSGICAEVLVREGERDLSSGCVVRHILVECKVVEWAATHPIGKGLASNCIDVDSGFVVGVVVSLLELQE